VHCSPAAPAAAGDATQSRIRARSRRVSSDTTWLVSRDPCRRNGSNSLSCRVTDTPKGPRAAQRPTSTLDVPDVRIQPRSRLRAVNPIQDLPTTDARGRRVIVYLLRRFHGIWLRPPTAETKTCSRARPRVRRAHSPRPYGDILWRPRPHIPPALPATPSTVSAATTQSVGVMRVCRLRRRAPTRQRILSSRLLRLGATAIPVTRQESRHRSDESPITVSSGT
jgi:hypothetical protein